MNTTREQLSTIDNTTDDQLLLNYATTSEDTAVRCAAIGKISKLPILLNLAIEHASKPQEFNIVSLQMAKMLLETPLNESEEGVIADYLNYLQQSDLATILIKAQDKSLALAALTCLHDQAYLASVIKQAPSQQIQCLALEKLKDLGLLQQIIDEHKDKDNAVLRTAHKQLQAIKKLAKDKEQKTVIAGGILEKLQAIDAMSDFGTDEYHSFLQTITEYHSIKNAIDASMQDELALTITKLHHKKDAYNAARKQEEHNKQAKKELLDNIRTHYEDFRSQIQCVEGSREIAEMSATLTQALKTYQQAVQDLEINCEELSDILASLEKHNEHLNWLATEYQNIENTIDKASTVEKDAEIIKMLDCLQRLENMRNIISGKWSNTDMQPPLIKRLLTSIEITHALEKSIEAKRGLLHTQADRAMADLEAAMDNTGYNKLLRRLNKIQQKITLLTGEAKKDLSARAIIIARQLEHQRKQHVDAVAPKLVALCEKAESYQVSQEQSANSILNSLRAWQTEWKDLSQGLLQNEYWSRFKQATEAIYEIYKDKQQADHTKRRVHDELRIAIIARIKNQIEQWNSADQQPTQQATTKFKNEIHNEWKLARPFGNTKNLDQEFHTLMQTVSAKLDAQYEQHIKSKEELIANAEALLTDTRISHHEAVNRNRLLMLRWKNIGHCGKQEQKLWQAFRSVRDQLNKHLHAQKEKANATQDIFQAQALIKAAQSLTNESDLEELQKLQNEFAAIKWNDQRDRRFWSAKLDKTTTRTHSAQRTKANAKYNLIKDKIKQVIHSIASTSDFDNALNELPSSLAKRMKEARDIGTDVNLTDTCISLEIAVGMTTPPEYENLRKQIQLQALQKKFNAQNESSGPEESYMTLLLAYIGAVTHNKQQDVQERTAQLLTNTMTKINFANIH